MTIEELEGLRELNEMDLLMLMAQICSDSENMDDAEKVVKGIRSTYAGRRLREKMMDIKLLADIIRDKVQIRSGAKWGDKRKFALDKAIEKKIESLKKEDEQIEKNKQRRIERLMQNNG
jgi:hypothetical protein